jgi:hypothetical protein
VQAARQAIHVAGLCLVLTGLLGSPVAAEPDAAAPGDAAALPAVDGLNAKIAGFGGAVEEQALYGGAGSVTLPLGQRFGLQLDGLVTGFDSEGQGDVTIAGTAAHLFWRDPAQGLLGAYGHYIHADAFDGVDIFAGGVEGALYWGQFTLEGVAGVEGGEVDTSFGNFDIDTRFFDVAQVAWYPVDDLKLSAGHIYSLDQHAALFGAEWGLDAGSGIMASLFANGSVSEDGDGAVLGGLRLYFGQQPKPLIRRHREDDPMITLDTYTGGRQRIISDHTTYGIEIDCLGPVFMC